MDNEIDVRKGRHCVFDLHVHLVFVTKYRHKVFTDKHLTRLETIFHDVCENFNCRLEEFNGETDHVHLLISFPPTVELARLVNSLKGVSSRYMRRDYPELAQHYWRAKRLWSGSYYAGTAGGAPLHTLKNYIENQTDQPIKKERRRRFTPVLKDRVPASKHDGKEGKARRCAQ